MHAVLLGGGGVTFFCLTAEPQPDSGVRCCRGHQNVGLLHVDGIQCTNGTSMAFTLHGLGVLEKAADRCPHHVCESSQDTMSWGFYLKQEGYLLILSPPDDDATVGTSWDKMPLWSYGSNHRYIEAEHYCLVATTATKIMIYYYFVIIGNKTYPYSDSIPHTNLINSGSSKPMRAFLSEAMKCSFSITSSPSSPQSGLGIHLTTFTLPVCPFSNVKTRFSWNRTHLFGTLVFSNAGEPGVQRTLQSQQRNSTTSGS